MPLETARVTLPPKRDEIQVWYCATSESPDAGLLARCQEILSADELARAARFMFDRDRNTYLVAHALVRTRLSQATGVDPVDWAFVANKYGRPEISAPKEQEGVRFNLSHTRGLVACALNWQRDIGVDVEDLDRLEGSLNVARRFFAASEVETLARVPESMRRLAFFDYWTLKESYIKARGMGLALPLRQFAFDLTDASEIRISFGLEIDDDPAQWEFHATRPTPRHRLALAVRRPPGEKLRITIRETTPF